VPFRARESLLEWRSGAYGEELTVRLFLAVGKRGTRALQPGWAVEE
jgi:hypothetical protein